MANSTVTDDYLNLIERALMMGISDNINAKIKTWDAKYPLTAADLNSIPEGDVLGNYDRNIYSAQQDEYGGWIYYGERDTSIGKGRELRLRYNWTLSDTTDFANGDKFTMVDPTQPANYRTGRVFEAKSSGADITKNEFNIGATRKDTLTNLKATLEHENAFSANDKPKYTIELREYDVVAGVHPNFVDRVSPELVFTNAYTKQDLMDMEGWERTLHYNEGSGTIEDGLGLQNPAGGSTTLQETLASGSTDTTLTVSDASNFVGMQGAYLLIDKEFMLLSHGDDYVDESANTIKVSRVSGNIHADLKAHSSGASIYWARDSNSGGVWRADWTSGVMSVSNHITFFNNPPKGYYDEQTDAGFHVYGAFPDSSEIKFPAIVVQQVASGFEEKFFGDNVTFGSDTSSSSGEVYGITFLIHIFTDENTVIPLGKTARYGQRRLTNWMMLNIANAIQGLDWAVYQEQELEVLERHLAQWRDIGFMPQAGWYGATAEFDIFFLNKR